MESVMFFVLSAIAVAAGVGVVAQKNAMRSALFLLVNFCCLAGLYILLNAQFVAVVQVIIYAGAVVVLFLFAVMLLGAERAQEGFDSHRHQKVLAILMGMLLLAALIFALLSAGFGSMPALVRADNVREVGIALLTDFAVPFELASVVLLVAIIGALVLAKKRGEG